MSGIRLSKMVTERHEEHAHVSLSDNNLFDIVQPLYIYFTMFKNICIVMFMFK